MRQSLLLLVALIAAATASPSSRNSHAEVLASAPAEARSAVISPSQADPLQKRDGAHHGGGGHGGFIGASGGSSYASPPQSFGGSSGGHGFGGADHGHGFGGADHGHGGGIASSASSYSSGFTSNHIGGSGGGGGYGAPQQSYGPPKQQGYYYYYYPVQVQDDKKKSDGGFMDKMKKLFEPIMYPWNSMMEYFGYGGSDYESYDYDYDSYGSYARSMVARASEYVPWDAVNEIGDVVTQDQCIEYFACLLGSYGRDYTNMHFLLEYFLPEERTNSYTRSFKDSVLQKTECSFYRCPLFRRRQQPQTN